MRAIQGTISDETCLVDEGQKAPLHVLQWPMIKDIQMVTRDVLLHNCTVVVALVTTPLPVAEGNLWTLTMAIVDLEISASPHAWF